MHLWILVIVHWIAKLQGLLNFQSNISTVKVCSALFLGTLIVKIRSLLMLKNIATMMIIVNIGKIMEIYQDLLEGMKKQYMKETLQPMNIAL